MRNGASPRAQPCASRVSARSVIGVVSLCVLIVSSVLLGLSFDTVEPDQWGIRFNGNTQQFETDRLYGAGRYLVGLGQYFIKFPRTLQTVVFSNSEAEADAGHMPVRSRDGMIINMELSFQYRLSKRPEDLVRIYMHYEDKWEYFYMLAARSVLRDAASQYLAFDFFERRPEIAENMRSRLNSALQEMYAEAYALQLLNLEFNSRECADCASPSLSFARARVHALYRVRSPAHASCTRAEFASAIEDTQVANQDIEQARFEQQRAIVESDRALRVANITANVTVLSAQAEADAILAVAQAEASAIVLRLQKQADAFLSVRQQLGLNSSKALLTYAWLLAAKDSEARQSVVGLETPSVLRNATVFSP